MSQVTYGNALYDTHVDLNSGVQISIAKILEGGNPVLLNFWGVLCFSCIDEIEELNRLYDSRLKLQNVKFISINTDGYDDGELRDEMEKHGIEIDYPNFADPELRLTNLFVNGFIPHNVIICPDGSKTFESTGYNDKLFSSLKKKLLNVDCSITND